MFERMIVPILLSIMMLTLSVFGGQERPSQKKNLTVTFLPIQQQQADKQSVVDESLIETAFRSQMKRLTGVTEVKYFELDEAMNRQLVDDAVFELLVTNDLKQTLNLLETLENKDAQQKHMCRIAAQNKIDYLVSISTQTKQNKLVISYDIIETQTHRSIECKIYTDVLNDPLGTVSDLAKYVVASLWKIQCEK